MRRLQVSMHSGRSENNRKAGRLYACTVCDDYFRSLCRTAKYCSPACVRAAELVRKRERRQDGAA